MTIRWTSRSNANYRIERADELLDQNTAWRILCYNYPSHGTNTFWLDTGNYHYRPPILHPKYVPKRFYRVVEEDEDTATNKPSVSITWPTNGFVASDNLIVTVAATTPMATLTTKFYVDGQEMWPSDDGSNYVVNTCEWANGPHTLFATTESLSSYSGGGLNAPLPSYAHAVSPYVTVDFSNLVTMISFSEYDFQPELGQTQKVTAVFAANSDWTLRIKDRSSNVVRTATGSGASMEFDWDGKGDGGVTLQPDPYYFYISAETNGLPYSRPSGDGDGGGGSPPSPSFYSTEDADFFALPPLPPGLSFQDEDGNDVSMIEVPRESYSTSSRTTLVLGGAMESIADDFSGPLAQNAPTTPVKPPVAAGEGLKGKFGIGYQTYTANGDAGFTPPHIVATGGGLITYMTFETKGSTPNFKRLRNDDTM
jgi:hypothetical protein